MLALAWLQWWQEPVVFCQLSRPPATRGRMWSTSFAGSLQYAQGSARSVFSQSVVSMGRRLRSGCRIDRLAYSGIAWCQVAH